MIQARYLQLTAAFFLLLFAGCTAKAPIKPISGEENLAVAGFVTPDKSWKIINYYRRPDANVQIKPQTIQNLNSILLNQLEKKEIQHYRGPAWVAQCQEIILHESGKAYMSANQYWIETAKCVPAKYILVPFIYQWRERKGGEWGVDQPAKVVFDLYLLDANEQKVASWFHFEEEQKSLSENLMNIKSFIQHQGKWVSAEELAREGIFEGLRELGF